MATLTKSTGTVTLSGAAEKVTLPASYGWVWVKNMSDSDIFAGLSADISEGADGVMTIPAGECGRVQMDGSREFYLLGTGNALVVAQNYADCPFKAVKKGGEIPDLSAYAKKTDIPTELPANGGNADTVENKGSIDFINVSASRPLETSLNALPFGTFFCEDQFTPDFPKKADGSSYGQFGLLDCRNYSSIFYQTMMFENGTVIHRARIAHFPDWTEWAEIYTSGNKPYLTGSATVEASSDVCVSNHGFTPSAVIWWDGSSSGVAVSFDDSQFIINVMSTEKRTVNYLMFK